MKCPKDGNLMVGRMINGVTVDTCPKCGGLWTDKGELAKVAGNLVTEHELIFRGDSKRLCPRCGRRMHKADFHSVIVEECDCGIYFDAGEAEKIIGRFLATKGRSVTLTLSQLAELGQKGSIVVGDTEIVVLK